MGDAEQPSREPAFATRTTTRLLDALHDYSNEPVWNHIDARYRPVIKGLARRLGLSESDADEVAQLTLTEFVRAYREKRYDRSKGRLSSWILGIAHNTVLRVFRQNRRASSGGAVEDSPMDESSLRSYWDDERDKVILVQALGLLRDESSVDDRSLTAFELTALRGVSTEVVAEQCAMSVDQVYVARSRVTKKLKSLVQQLTHAYEEDV